MQVHALYDRKGRILAAVQVDTTKAAPSPAPRPKPKRGQSVGVFTVPAEHAHLSFAEACAQLMVKTEGKAAVLAAKPAKRRRS